MSTSIGMMRSLFLDVQLEFATSRDRAMSEEILLRMLGVLAMLDLYQLRKNPQLPKLYSKEAGIVWCPPDQMEGAWIAPDKIRGVADYLRSQGMADNHVAIIIRLISGAEIFQDSLTLYRAKKGDCDRLVSHRIAELWLAGIMAGPYLIPYPNGTGGTTYHAVVIYPDKSIECPSAILGMPVAPGVRAEEIRKNLERHGNLVKAATELMVVDGASPEALGSILDAAAYSPRGGYRRAA